jgi:hypothetical protein
MPWGIEPLADRRSGAVDTDHLAPVPDHGPDEHVFFANVAFHLTNAEVIGAIGDEHAPHLSPEKVVGIRVTCGRCGLVPDGEAGILAVNEPCPGELVIEYVDRDLPPEELDR